MADKKETEALVTNDDAIQSAISAAMKRIAEVEKTPSLVEELVKQGWRDWDDSAANILVSDSSDHPDVDCVDDDEEVPQAA
jgi:hypothetical protein